MIGILAERKLRAGMKPGIVTEEVLPNWQLEEARG